MPEISIRGRDIDVLATEKVVIRNATLAEGIASDKAGVVEFLSTELGPLTAGDIEVDDSGNVVISNPRVATQIHSAMGRAVANAADTNYVLCGANYNCKPK